MRTQPNSQPIVTEISPMRRIERSPAFGGGESPSAREPLGLRLRVQLTRARLDREIVSGRACTPTDALALRVRQLTHQRTRQQIARQLRSVVEYVDRRDPRPIITAVVIEPAAVRAGRNAILGLAHRLEVGDPVQPRGIVLARRLLTDGSGPMFNRGSGRTVTEAIWEVVDALEGRTTSEVDTGAI
jgi:hypothetical protein